MRSDGTFAHIPVHLVQRPGRLSIIDRQVDDGVFNAYPGIKAWHVSRFPQGIGAPPGFSACACSMRSQHHDGVMPGIAFGQWQNICILQINGIK